MPIQPSINRGDREEPTGCFAFSPLCRGVSHQLASTGLTGLDRQGKQRSEQRQLAEAAEEAEEDGSQTCQTPHMIDYLLHGGHGIEERGMLEHRKHCITLFGIGTSWWEKERQGTTTTVPIQTLS
ncbi:hypothetical protein J7T55_004568 [Diaporthe amygdali]|uniref:uncharacterized protein n=1 Tax=Phomopsis amygdali TaxID=1214568 RepID=UPI0022FE7CDF|nr:uncharacterized protein J7T55_004568 [Diaporthe amygdali]KAJ0114826.1 hypothetical protein J7T55_004568 [Diaporthe amygdali]